MKHINTCRERKVSTSLEEIKEELEWHCFQNLLYKLKHVGLYIDAYMFIVSINFYSYQIHTQK